MIYKNILMIALLLIVIVTPATAKSIKYYASYVTIHAQRYQQYRLKFKDTPAHTSVILAKHVGDIEEYQFIVAYKRNVSKLEQLHLKNIKEFRFTTDQGERVFSFKPEDNEGSIHNQTIAGIEYASTIRFTISQADLDALMQSSFFEYQVILYSDDVTKPVYIKESRWNKFKKEITLLIETQFTPQKKRK
ncbi:hypothetical protein PVA45_07290 (plasmid) [Entomospira entomophila]|nr:hypothetical protein [Entomospira entomophilus]WDI36252.1 hypothetical protein PVA45_07290 [Entomospira entomophilus]